MGKLLNFINLENINNNILEILEGYYMDILDMDTTIFCLDQINNKKIVNKILLDLDLLDIFKYFNIKR